MSLSPEFKARMLEEWEKIRPLAELRLSTMSFTGREICIPIVLDGVIDKAVYNVAKKRFEKLIVTVGDTEGLSLAVSPMTVISAETREEEIILPEEGSK